MANIMTVLDRLANLAKQGGIDVKRLRKLKEKYSIARRDYNDIVNDALEQIQILEGKAVRLKREYDNASKRQKSSVASKIERIFQRMDAEQKKVDVANSNIGGLNQAIDKIDQIIIAAGRKASEEELDEVAVQGEEVAEDTEAFLEAAEDLSSIDVTTKKFYDTYSTEDAVEAKYRDEGLTEDTEKEKDPHPGLSKKMYRELEELEEG